VGKNNRLPLRQGTKDSPTACAVIGCCKKNNRLSKDRGLTAVQQQCAVIG